MFRLGPLSTSTGLAAGGRRAAFAAKPASLFTRGGRYGMGSLGHKAGSGAVSQQLGVGEQAITQAIEGLPVPGRESLIETGLVGERQRDDAGMHGAAAGAQAERGPAA